MFSYSLDTVNILRIINLTFTDTFTSLQVETGSFLTLPLQRKITIFDEMVKRLAWIERKGYLSSIDLTSYPVISELLPAFLNGDQGVESLKYINGSSSKESYKWIYNIILLNLYYLALLSLDSLSNEGVEMESNSVVDLKVKERELYNKIDSSIRHHMRKQGISIKQNVYTGFDTEYKHEEIACNSLLSAQLAVSTRINLKLPKANRYRISSLDVDKNTIQIESKSSEIFNYSKVENTIEECLQRIKQIKYGNYDESMLILTECFKSLRDVRYYEGEEYTLFALPRSAIQPYMLLEGRVSLKELLLIVNTITKTSLEEGVRNVVNLITDIAGKGFTTQLGVDVLKEEIYKTYSSYSVLSEMKVESEKVLPYINSELSLKSDAPRNSKGEKRLKRIFLSNIVKQGVKVSITLTKHHYFIAHLTQADLSLLTDFDEIKDELSIVNGSFVTMREALKYCGNNIHIRDTMLLAPGGAKSLASIGKLYGEAYHKIYIGKDKLNDMESFLQTNREEFIEYALRDALVSLIHSLWMEEFNFSLGGVGVPLTLSSIGRKFVKQKWKEEKYRGYQISSKYQLGNVSTTITPKGINAIKSIGFVLPYYIANYKGGRNECFMYGIDRDKMWYDYDLTNAYTTVMSMAGHPDYARYQRLNEYELNRLSTEEIIYSYLIILADFDFPASVKYPSIPCFVDENSIIFPRRGTGVLTGAEYLLTKSQNCNLKIKEVHMIPFLTTEYKNIKPFETILKIVQEQRREYPKGSINNLMYKEIGNSIYGSVVRGLGNKKKFDIKTKSSTRLYGDELSNPLIASWTTAFIRSIIGECLQGIQNLGGLAVSVTTDGFITDVVDIESRISHQRLISEYKKIRAKLSGNDSGIELKHSGRGLLVWTTRGQLGFESKIIATTGFQHYYNLPTMIKVLTETFKSENKSLEFIQSRLRSAKEVYTKGGHVTQVYMDQQFRMHFDNKRVLEQPIEQIEESFGKDVNVLKEVLIDSKPLIDVNHGENLRYIGKLTKMKQYSRFSSSTTNLNRYNKYEDLAITNFVKCLLAEPPMFNLHRVGLESYKAIVEYIKCFKPSSKISPESIARLKNRSVKWRSVPKLKQSEEFINYIKDKFNDFDEDSFFRL